MSKSQKTQWGPRPIHWRMLPWNSFATPAGKRIKIAPDSTAKQVTVRVRHQGIVERKIKKYQPRIIKNPNQTQITAGQFIISRIDARNGACGIVPNELDGAIVTNDFRVFDLDAQVVNPGYLDYLVGLPTFWRLCGFVSDGTTNRVRLDLELFDSMLFPIPPLDEQRTIYQTLRRIDKAGKEQEGVIFKTEQLRNSLLHRLLIRSLPGHHTNRLTDRKRVRLIDIAYVEFSSVDKKTIQGEIPIILCNYHDVINHRFIRSSIDFMWATASIKEYAKWILKKGDVIFTKDAEIGKISVVEDTIPDLLLGYHLGRARPKRELISGTFLALSLQTSVVQKQFQRLQTGVTISGIKLEDCRLIQLELPTLEEQESITAILSIVDDTIEQAKVVTEKQKQLLNSLLDELLTRGLPYSKPSGI